MMAEEGCEPEPGWWGGGEGGERSLWAGNGAPGEWCGTGLMV